MGVKYSCSLYSTHGTLYKVDLLDSSYSSSVTEIKLMDPGFTLEYDGQGDEIYSAIKSSRLTINLCIEDNVTGSALLTWLRGQVLVDSEDRFSAALYKNGSIMWYGGILPDLSGFSDASKPFEFVLTASDGLGRLKDFTFDYAVSTDNLAKFTQLIYNILKKTPAYITGTQTNLFSTCVDWYESQMPAKSSSEDPLFRTYVHSKTFAKLSDDGVWEGMTYYDALEAICKHWAMRVFMDNGLFKFVQIGTYEDNVVSQYERFYKRTDGTYSSASSFAPQVDINVSTGSLPRVMSGGQWNYYPGVKDVYLKFPFLNKNFLNGEQDLPYTQYVSSPLVGGVGVALQFNMELGFRFPGIPSSGVNIEFNITVDLGGTQYLKKDPIGATITWEGTASIYETLLYCNESNKTFNIGFITPEIPSGSYDDMTITIDGLVVTDYLTGAIYSTPTDYDRWRTINSTSLKFVSSDSDSDFINYAAHNSTYTGNSYDITEPDAIFGDGYFAGMYGSLSVWDGAGIKISAGLWQVNQTGTEFTFNILRIRDIAGSQTKPVGKYQGAIVGNSSIGFTNSIVYSGRVYIFNGGSLTGIPDEWNGEMVEVDYKHGNLTIDDPVVLGGDQNRNTLERRSQTTIYSEVDQSVINQRIYKALEKISLDTKNQISQAVAEVQNQINSRVWYQMTTTTADDMDVTPYSQIIFCTDAITLTMPSATAMFSEGRTCEISVINQDGNSVTINAQTGEQIDGNDSLTLLGGRSIIIVSDNSNLYILASFKHA